MLKKKAVCISLAIGVGIGCSATSQAEKMTGSGHNANQNVSTQVTKLPDGRSLMAIHDASIIMGNNQGNPFHLTTLDCYSTYIAAADGNSGNGNGYCHGVDKDGDVWWITFGGDFGGGTWAFTGGTGKFDGISGGGTFKPVSQMQGGRSLSVWDGTWDMKKK
jgi:hypothetical protein